jgi:peroxiredoxin Q/BCP
MALKQGDIAPDFSAKLTDGSDFKLSDQKAKYIILYFYPKDDTPGCTLQACGIRDAYSEIKSLGAEIYGISRDDLKSHKKFVEKHGLNFPIIVDDEKIVCLLYDVLKDKSMFGKHYEGVERTTYILDQNLKIVEVWEKVNPIGHSARIVEWLKTR